AFRAGSAGGSSETLGNEGFAATMTILARNDHAVALGAELGHYSIPDEEVPIDEFSQYTGGGRTNALTFESRFRPTHGTVRPTVSLGLGPYVDYRKMTINTVEGVIEDTEIKGNFGAHVGPGVQFGSRDWSASIEGRWHVIGGRGYFSDFFTL